MVKCAWLAWLVALLPACVTAELDPPIVHTVGGPASGQHVQKILALHPTCGKFIGVHLDHSGTMVSDNECPPALLDGIAQRVRSTFDFIGYQVIDVERLNAITASHHEVIERSEVIERRRHNRSEWSMAERVGATFEDAAPREQLALLHELGADALLTTRVWVGAGIGLSSRRNVVVQLRLTTAADHRMIWARRCELQVGGLETDDRAIERAAVCAAQEVPRP